MKALSKVALLGLVSGLMLVGTGCGGQSGLPEGMSPEDVISEALINSQDVTKSVFEMTMTADLKGDVDGEKTDLKGTMKLSGTGDEEAKTVQVVFNMDGSMNDEKLAIDFELRANDDGVFGKVGKVSTSTQETQDMVDLFLDDYIGNWVKLSFIKNEDVTEGSYGDIDYEEGDELPFTNIQYKGTKNILGVESYHFTADVDEKLVLGMVEDSAPQDLAQTEDFLESAEMHGEVYVAVKEMVMTGFTGTLKMNDPELNGDVEISFLMNPTKADKVATPSYDMELTEEDLASLMFGGAMMPSTDMELDFDNSMMMDDFDETMTDEEALKLLEEMEAGLDAI